jgi:methylated-DNA-[protein]-cysteine S-methyltransferase
MAPTNDTLYSTVHRTPVGALTLIASDRGLRAILWEKATSQSGGIRSPLTRNPMHPILQQTAQELDEYFAGTRTAFDVPLDLKGTSFQLAAWHALADIPFGATATYGQQAHAIGVPRAARAVGAANGANPVCIVLPCHRVIGANGSLTGFGGGLAIKQWLLDHEARTIGRWPSRHPIQQRLSMPVA